MSFIGTAIGVIGGIMQAAGQSRQAKDIVAMGEYNAQVPEQQAALVGEKAKLNEYSKRKVMASNLSTQAASYAKAGVAMSGSPIDVYIDSQANAELDIVIDNFNSKIEALGYGSEAQQRRFYAEQDAKLMRRRSQMTLLSTGAGLVSKIFAPSGSMPKKTNSVSLGDEYTPGDYTRGIINLK